jgi:uncharacterized membrane protein YphA (DoxX/SURF4 family)
VASARGVVVLRLFLGALFCTVFFENIAFNRYTTDGYERLIDRYAERNNAPGFWSDGVMGFFADNSEVFAPVQFVTELSFAVLLVLGLATAVVALAAAGFLFSLWLSELGLFWVWELLSITAIAAVVGLSSLPGLRRSRSLRERVLGGRTFGALGLAPRLGIAVAAGLALLGVILAADNTGGDENSTVAVRSALLFGGLLVVAAFLDELREDEPAVSGSARERAGR